MPTLTSTSTSTSQPRDLEPASALTTAPGRVALARRNAIAVIGIDRYQHASWRPLANAVADARGAAKLFEQLGFEQVAALYGDAATGAAIEGLVTDDLTGLGPEDNLVLFFAGHGSTRSHQLGDQVIKTGYLIPADASDRTATWIELDGWLRAVALLPAKHILVILDACHSGLALGSVMRWRDGGPTPPLPMSTLRARRSRRIITSALDNEQALDSGPYPGHSLFTGCLIELLVDGDGRPGSQAITGSELGVVLQKRVESYPKAQQTPDFGTFDFDERGEMVIPFLKAPKAPDADGGGGGGGEDDEVVIDPTPPRRWGWVGLAAVAALALATALYGPWRRASNAAPTHLDAPLADAAPPDAHAHAGAPPPPIDAAPPTPADAPAPTDAPPRPIDPAPVAPAAPAVPTTPRTDPPRRAASTQPPASQGGCPAGMVRVPAGTFRMGSPGGEGADNERPQHEVTLSGYCIDRTEVTVKEYRRCVAADACSPTPPRVRIQPEPSTTTAECNGASRPNHPINCVDWDQAAAFCTWKQKRLPTEAEWEYAARGSAGRRYPWGDQPPTARRLNACSGECVPMVERILKQTWDGMDNDGDGWPMTAPVGSYPAGASPFGALDMAGNVAEWTAGSFENYTSAAVTNPQPPAPKEDRVFRGGSWIVGSASEVRAASRSWTYAYRAYFDIGFRCVLGD